MRENERYLLKGFNHHLQSVRFDTQRILFVYPISITVKNKKVKIRNYVYIHYLRMRKVMRFAPYDFTLN